MAVTAISGFCEMFSYLLQVSYDVFHYIGDAMSLCLFRYFTVFSSYFSLCFGTNITCVSGVGNADLITTFGSLFL